MSPPRLHADEVDLDDRIMGHLVDTRFPHCADRPLRRLDTTGTDNAIFRLGDGLGNRAPRLVRAHEQIHPKSRGCAPLPPHLPAAVHEPVAIGDPDPTYPFPFLVFRWIDGTDLGAAPSPDPVGLALELAEFVIALGAIDPAGGPRGGRRTQAIGATDRATRAAIAALADEPGPPVDIDRALAVWDGALAAGEWNRPPVWVHGDLLPGNILVADGHLVGVVDWSSGGLGDPAADTMLAWALPSAARAAYRDALGVDDATWRRGRGWVIEQAASFIAYYRDTIPDGVALARARLDAVLAADD